MVHTNNANTFISATHFGRGKCWVRAPVAVLTAFTLPSNRAVSVDQNRFVALVRLPSAIVPREDATVTAVAHDFYVWCHVPASDNWSQ